MDVHYSVNGITQPAILDNFFAHLVPGDSLGDPLHLDHISHLAFVDGDNVVVIWPISLSSTINDSLSIPVFVNSGSGIYSIGLASNIGLVYSDKKINIKYPKNNSSTLAISIVNIAGQIVYSSIGIRPNFINVADLPEGIYFVKAVSSDGKVSVLKFISGN